MTDQGLLNQVTVDLT